MHFKQLGRTDVKLPAIGMGTWEMGGARERDDSYDEEAIKAIRKAIELGLNLIDTAEMYGAGHCEEVVGEAIKPFPREKLFIVTKVWHNHLHHDDVIKAAENSLKRLRTDWIDLYLIHFPNPEVPLIETMQAMEKLVGRKLIRFIGVSNFNISQVEEAKSHLSENEIVANQVDYSLLVRGRERDLIPYCQKSRITVMAFKPLAKPSAKGGLSQNEFLQEIGKKYGKTPAQVALNWLISKEPVIAIPKAMNLDHLEENTGAMGWALAQEDMESISTNFSGYLSEYGITRPSLT
ncbi:aldo/keto reductase [Chloroflexota bacterium]